MSPPLGVALLILLAMAAWSDLRHRRIPHPLVAAVAILWLVTIPALGPGAATVAAVTAGGVLALGFLVWRCGWLGGGDVKLIAALSLWAGPDTVSGLLLAIALSGGVLALLMRLATRIACLPIAVAVQVQAARLAPAPARLPAILRGATGDAAISLPYGVAVAGGGAWLVHHLAFA